MTVREFNAHVQTVEEQDMNTLRVEMLKALLNDGGGAARTFIDPIHGSISVQPLANGDAIVYPPLLGSTDEATATHYLESGYAAASISDTNNPFKTLTTLLNRRFGRATGGRNVVTFIHSDQEQKARNLTDFYAVEDRFIRTSALTDVPVNFPSVPGEIIGHVSGTWVVVWDWIPTGYLLSLHLEAPRPLKMRVDPAITNLTRGLHLAAQDPLYPFNAAHWSHAYGFGVGNRLNGAVMELGTDGTYTIPTAYA